MPDYREGQTATAKDGRQVIYTGGNWVNKPAAAGAAPASRASMQERKQAQAALLKEQPMVDVAHRAMGALDEFDAINDRLKPTGGVLNHATHAVQGWLGNADLDRLNQLSKGFARNQRQAGEGSTSDFEGRMYNAMVGGMDRPSATNKQFSATARTQGQDIIDRHQFRDDFVTKNGTLVGADAAYQNRPRKAPPSTRKGKGGWTVTEGQ